MPASLQAFGIHQQLDRRDAEIPDIGLRCDLLSQCGLRHDRTTSHSGHFRELAIRWRLALGNMLRVEEITLWKAVPLISRRGELALSSTIKFTRAIKVDGKAEVLQH